MWTVVYIAYNNSVAEELSNYLNDEGIMVRTHVLGLSKDGEPNQIEILVSELEAEDALELIQTYLSEKVF